MISGSKVGLLVWRLCYEPLKTLVYEVEMMRCKMLNWVKVYDRWEGKV